MNIIIDIVIVAIILICIISGYKKGLIGMAFSIASFLVALIIAFIFFNPVASLIMENTQLDETIKNTIITNFTSETGEIVANENMPEMIINYIEERTNEVKNIGVEAAANGISQISIKALSFIGLFIIAKLVLGIFKKIADFVAKLPLIKQVNKGGGLIVGFLKGLLIVYIALAIMLLVMPFFAEAAIYEAIRKSIIGSFMYNNNLLLKLIF